MVMNKNYIQTKSIKKNNYKAKIYHRIKTAMKYKYKWVNYHKILNLTIFNYSLIFFSFKVDAKQMLTSLIMVLYSSSDMPRDMLSQRQEKKRKHKKRRKKILQQKMQKMVGC